MTISYTQALGYIYSFTNYEVEPQYRYAPGVIDPTRPARLLSLLQNPHLGYPSIHIAGTKGKGSVAAICASALSAAGLRTGLYLSPHLQSFTERIQVNGSQISHTKLASLVSDVRPAVAQVEGITTFELITALAFLHFARCQVEVAVIEVGLGGRLDATNVISPLVSVITSLSYDHTHLLGETLAEIAAEKGGIIKPGVPLVSAPQPEEALAVLERIAAEKSARLTLVGRDWQYESGHADLGGQRFYADCPDCVGRPGGRYHIPLLGEHQVINATVALAALDIARRRLPGLTDQAIRSGLEQVEWPGRFHILHRRPVVVADGAHNVASVRQVRQTVEALFPDRRRILVFGATADKDLTEMIRVLVPMADEVILTAADHPRAAAPADLHRRLEEQGFGARQAPTVSSAIAMAWEVAGPDDVICITGSLFVVGDALTAWEEISERMGAVKAAVAQ